MPDRSAVMEHNGPSRTHQLVFVLFQLSVIYVLALNDSVQYLPLVVLGILYYIWSIRRPEVWLFTVISFYILILQPSEGITIWEILFAVYFFGIIGIWFIRKWLASEQIIFTFADRMLIVFQLICVLSFVPGMMNHADPVKWFRESIIFFSYLFYFPAREAMLRQKSLRWVGLGFLILSSYVAVSNFIKYKTAATSAVYLWQLLSGRQTANEPLFLTAIVVGISLFLFARTTSLRIVLLAMISFFTIALAVTFSRGYWVGAIVAVAVMLYLLQGRDRWKLAVSLAVLAAAGVTIIFLLFHSTGSAILESMAQRLSSHSLHPTRDISLESRLAESRVIVHAILTNPILGYGLGVLFKFPDPILKWTYQTWYVHNGYLFLWFKLGFFGLLTYLMTFGSMIVDASAMLKRRAGQFESYLLVGISSLLLSMLIISLTSPQFIARDSILIINLSWAYIGSEHLREEQSAPRLGKVSSTTTPMDFEK